MKRMVLFVADLALLVCAATLIDTTYACFTDTASVTVNKIQTGTVDIDLVDDAGNSVVGRTLKFGTEEAVLWAPGRGYALENLKILNQGTLPVKYTVAISGINGDTALNKVITWDHHRCGGRPVGSRWKPGDRHFRQDGDGCRQWVSGSVDRGRCNHRSRNSADGSGRLVADGECETLLRGRSYGERDLFSHGGERPHRSRLIRAMSSRRMTRRRLPRRACMRIGTRILS